MKTVAEITALKASWAADPCWDLEDTEGFEDHTDELKQYREEQEASWEADRTKKLEHLAETLGCPGNIRLASYIDTLESRLFNLEQQNP